MNLTTKQAALLQVILAGDKSGDHCDIDQILERLPYQTTKQSLQFSLRAMVDKGCIEKAGRVVRRQRQRETYKATMTGVAMFNPGFIYGIPGSPTTGSLVSEMPDDLKAEEVSSEDALKGVEDLLSGVDDLGSDF